MVKKKSEKEKKSVFMVIYGTEMKIPIAKLQQMQAVSYS